MMLGKGGSGRSLVAAGAVFLGLSLLPSQPVRAETALWYELQSGSRVQLADGSGTELTGKFALLGCMDRPAGAGAAKITIPFYAVRFDNTPEVLEAQVVDRKSSQIFLFGAPYENVAPGAFMGTLPDGKVGHFQWYLRHQLTREDGAEAEIFRRELNISEGKESRVLFEDRQGCPSSISLSLNIRDTQETFKPEVKTLPDGQQVVAPVPKQFRMDIVGQVTIVANAIWGSEEQVQRKVPERSPVKAIAKERPDATPSPKVLRAVPVRKLKPRLQAKDLPDPQGGERAGGGNRTEGAELSGSGTEEAGN